MIAAKIDDMAIFTESNFSTSSMINIVEANGAVKAEERPAGRCLLQRGDGQNRGRAQRKRAVPLDDEYIRFLFTDTRREKSVLELNQLFYPNLARMTSDRKSVV